MVPVTTEGTPESRRAFTECHYSPSSGFNPFAFDQPHHGDDVTDPHRHPYQADARPGRWQSDFTERCRRIARQQHFPAQRIGADFVPIPDLEELTPALRSLRRLDR